MSIPCSLLFSCLAFQWVQWREVDKRYSHFIIFRLQVLQFFLSFLNLISFLFFSVFSISVGIFFSFFPLYQCFAKTRKKFTKTFFYNSFCKLCIIEGIGFDKYFCVWREIWRDAILMHFFSFFLAFAGVGQLLLGHPVF